ncbi:MAG: DUF1902 domain-containing protein [Pseudomonadota bacterium]
MSNHHRKSFQILACWDAEAEVFYSKSNIKGLHIEAVTLDEFEEMIMDVAVELIIANHIEAKDMASRPMKEWLPTILWRPSEDYQPNCA